MECLKFLAIAAIALLIAGCIGGANQAPTPTSPSPVVEPTVPGPATQPQTPPSEPEKPKINTTPEVVTTAPTGKPDLQLQSIEVTSPISTFMLINGSIANYNSGTATSPATKTAYYIDSEFIGAVDVPPIEPGKSVNTGISFVCKKAGTHVLSGKIDYENRVDEQNELNNGRAVNFNCV